MFLNLKCTLEPFTLFSSCTVVERSVLLLIIQL